jgi:signal transduction histidine kinase
LLQVADDGVGLNVAGDRGGFGLAGMNERITALGGTFNVRNHVDGKGTSVTARLPRQAPIVTPETEEES